jgi:hypothetical protein
MQSAPVQRAKGRPPSPNVEPQLPCSADFQVSNRNTTEFRISPNPNETQPILISNRNINPDVASGFPSQIRRFTLTNAEPHSPANPFLITYRRLETTPKHQKTKARDDF